MCDKKIDKIVAKNVLSYKKFSGLWWYLLQNHWSKVNGIYIVYFCEMILFNMKCYSEMIL